MKVYNRKSKDIGYTVMVRSSKGKQYNRAVTYQLSADPYFVRSKEVAKNYCSEINEKFSELPTLMPKPKHFARIKNGEIYPTPMIGPKAFWITYAMAWVTVYTLLGLGYDWAVFGVVFLVIATFVFFIYEAKTHKI